ncbi:hypothetical protein ACRE1U_00185 [Helicobacter himalayensis]|uniref:hypothetical protein n=1 Tax=Helicobacter himalayensis TaxID=1591088 RepID=UPI003D6F216F
MQKFFQKLSVIVFLLVLCSAHALGDVMLEEVEEIEWLEKSAESTQEFSQKNADSSVDSHSLSSLFSQNTTQTHENPTNPILPQNLLPQQYMLEHPLPKWIYATAIIEVYFSDGSQRMGFGTMLENGLFITSAQIVYDEKLIPKTIYTKMQDSSARVLICTNKLNVKAVDTQNNLALLESIASTDDYCHTRAKSYYHDRIEKRYFIDIFTNPTLAKKSSFDTMNAQKTTPNTSAQKNSTKDSMIFYAFVEDYYSFVPKALEDGDFTKAKNGVQGSQVAISDMQDSQNLLAVYDDFAYGRAFFSSDGVFLGILSAKDKNNQPIFAKRELIQEFLCSLHHHGVLKDNALNFKCTQGRL